ncbi:MAG: hypothetical protein U9Q99_02370 [Nanoarchaeota archaeon]|nr:hypothetical protein [Nanoarchaeota archaeon]
MDKNRRAFLTLYTVPEMSPGRLECSGVITADGRLIKQNLQLEIFNTARNISKEILPYLVSDLLLYEVSFYDSKTLFNRLEVMATKFKGTHSRHQNGSHDDASFRILDRDRLIEYLDHLEYPKSAPKN